MPVLKHKFKYREWKIQWEFEDTEKVLSIAFFWEISISLCLFGIKIFLGIP